MSRIKRYRQTTFALPPELLEALVVLANRTRVPQAAFVREGLAVVLKKYAAMLGEHAPSDLKAYAEPAHINAHNALAWSELHREPITIPVFAPPSCGACSDSGRCYCADPETDGTRFCSCAAGKKLMESEAAQ